MTSLAARPAVLLPIPPGDGTVFVLLLKDESGQDLIEYLLVGSLIALVALLGATNFGTQINGWFNWADANNNVGGGS